MSVSESESKIIRLLFEPVPNIKRQMQISNCLLELAVSYIAFLCYTTTLQYLQYPSTLWKEYMYNGKSDLMYGNLGLERVWSEYLWNFFSTLLWEPCHSVF